MLQRFRDQIKGWVATVIIGLLVVPFALWGVNSYFNYAQSDWVAMVDGDPISVGEFRSEYQQQLARFQQMFGAQYRPELFDTQTTRDQVVDQMVRRVLVERRTRDGGYRVSDAQLAEEIQKMEFFQVDGKFSREVMGQRLKSINMTPAQFDARLRKDMLLAQLPDAITNSEFITATELARAVALRDEQRAATWIAVPAVRFLPEIKLSDAELETWYAANKARYLTEEMVTLEYLELEPSSLKAADVEPTEAQLHEIYAAEGERFSRAEQRQARHILLDSSDPAKAEAEAQAIVARIQKGEDFGKLAQELSKDPGSAAQGGDLGWMERGVMVGAFDDAVFAMKEGEVRGPVRTEFGVHVIRLDGVRAAQSRPFEEVRAELAAKWRADQASERLVKASEQLADITYANPDSLEQAATALGLKVMTVAGVTRAGGGGIAVEQKVRDAAFSVDVLGERRNSSPIELEPEHLVVVRVAEHQPAVQRAFAEVRDQVLDAAREERAGTMAQALAEALAVKLRAGAIPEQLAKAERLPAPVTRTLKRSAQDAPPEVSRALFGAGQPVVGSLLAGVAPLANGDRMVFRVDAVIPGDAAAMAEAERDARRAELARRTSTIALTAYTAALEKASEVKYQKDKAQ